MVWHILDLGSTIVIQVAWAISCKSAWRQGSLKVVKELKARSKQSRWSRTYSIIEQLLMPSIATPRPNPRVGQHKCTNDKDTTLETQAVERSSIHSKDYHRYSAIVVATSIHHPIFSVLGSPPFHYE